MACDSSPTLSAFAVEPTHINTILAALRFFQESGQTDVNARSKAINHIATNAGRGSSLTNEQIDELCTRLSASMFQAELSNHWMLVEAVRVLRLYESLHDKLSDMVEGGRLTEAIIPKDYRWLAETLAVLAPATAQFGMKHAKDTQTILWLERATNLLSESFNAWDGEEDSVKEEHAEHIDRLDAFFRDWQVRIPSNS